MAVRQTLRSGVVSQIIVLFIQHALPATAVANSRDIIGAESVDWQPVVTFPV